MIPSAGTPIKVTDVLAAGVGTVPFGFEDELKRMLGARHVWAVNSGTTAFYSILRALQRSSRQGEVILPAYTAPSLMLPIMKAGLRLRLVDVSLDSFNLDTEQVADAVTDDTLALLAVHSFGLPVDIERIRQVSDVFVIDDAASSFGTSRAGKLTGAMGDAGFISFNRGKNLSTVAGGLIVTDQDELASVIASETGQLPLPERGQRLGIYVKAMGLSFAVRPWFYTIFSNLVSRYKYTTLHESFHSFQYTDFQRALGSRLLRRAEGIFAMRQAKGRLLAEALREVSGVRLPIMPDAWRIVCNQFPVLIEDARKRMRVVEAIMATGLEATILYDQPLHTIYGVRGQSYPNAEYMAQRLVLFPVHHYVHDHDLLKAVDALKKVVL